jgi:hypothetical protein
MIYVVKYSISPNSYKDTEIEADGINQQGAIAVEFYKHLPSGKHEQVAVFERSKFISAIKKG